MCANIYIRGESVAHCLLLPSPHQALTRETKLQTQSDHLVTLRRALRTPDGQDRDVLADFKSIAKYKKNGLDVELEFQPAPLEHKLFKWAFHLCRKQVRGIYDDSGYGWDDEEKKDELRDKGVRYLLVRQGGELVGFVSFRFSLQGEVVNEMEGLPAMFVDNIHLKEEVRLVLCFVVVW